MSEEQENVKWQSSPRLRVKIKSLAYEAKVIRFEERRAKVRKNFDLIGELHSHRKHEVRMEARDSLAAHAFLRGVPFKSIEPRATTYPRWKNVENMARRFAADKRVMDKWTEWRTEATAS